MSIYVQDPPIESARKSLLVLHGSNSAHAEARRMATYIKLTIKRRHKLVGLQHGHIPADADPATTSKNKVARLLIRRNLLEKDSWLSLSACSQRSGQKESTSMPKIPLLPEPASATRMR